VCCGIQPWPWVCQLITDIEWQRQFAWLLVQRKIHRIAALSLAPFMQAGQTHDDKSEVFVSNYLIQTRSKSNTAAVRWLYIRRVCLSRVWQIFSTNITPVNPDTGHLEAGTRTVPKTCTPEASSDCEKNTVHALWRETDHRWNCNKMSELTYLHNAMIKTDLNRYTYCAWIKLKLYLKNRAIKNLEVTTALKQTKRRVM